MDLAALLALHVHALHSTGRPALQEPERDEELTELSRHLDQLVRTVCGQVPACLSVSVVLTLASGSVTVGGGDRGRRPVLASLAVPLPLPDAGLAALLMLQSAEADAFLLLAGDLAGRLARHGLRLDEHLDLQVDVAGQVLSGDLADLRAVDQAAGALLEQGWTAGDAQDRLRALADAGHTDVPGAARRLLAGLRPPVADGSTEDGSTDADGTRAGGRRP